MQDMKDYIREVYVLKIKLYIPSNFKSLIMYLVTEDTQIYVTCACSMNCWYSHRPAR